MHLSTFDAWIPMILCIVGVIFAILCLFINIKYTQYKYGGSHHQRNDSNKDSVESIESEVPFCFDIYYMLHIMRIHGTFNTKSVEDIKDAMSEDNDADIEEEMITENELEHELSDHRYISNDYVVSQRIISNAPDNIQLMVPNVILSSSAHSSDTDSSNESENESDEYSPLSMNIELVRKNGVIGSRLSAALENISDLEKENSEENTEENDMII